MKIIEAMKRIKHLQEKTADLREKVVKYHADLSCETMVYPDQKAQVSEWIQSHSDTLQEIAKLRVAIQRTNLATTVTMELGGNAVSKTIAEWVHRRRDLAKLDLEMWAKMTDKNLREGSITNTAGISIPVTIRRYYEPQERDEKMALYKSEPTIIDGYLEVTNAVTDLIE